MANNKNNPTKKTKQKPPKQSHQSTIKNSYRIGALILVIIIIVSLLTMYSF